MLEVKELKPTGIPKEKAFQTGVGRESLQEVKGRVALKRRDTASQSREQAG